MKLFEQGMFTVSPNSTPDQLARKRERIHDMLRGNTNARYVGQGLGHLATGILAGKQLRDADKIEGKGREGADSLFASLLGGTPSQSDYTPAMVPQGDVPTGGADVADEIMQGLVARGLPEHVAQGFVMNMQDESGLNPGINEANPIVPGSRGGFGLYQLTGPRRRAYEQFAADRGAPLDSVDAQLDFLVQELQGSEVGAAQAIFATQDAGSAADAIVRKFLRPASEHMESRSAKYLGGAPKTIMSTSGQRTSFHNPPNNSAQLQAALANPWLSPEQKAVISQQIAQQQQRNDLIFRSQLKQQDPMYQAKLAELQSGGGSGNVRASQILADGTVVQSTDTGVRVYSADGTLLEGEAASEAIKAANAYDVENQRSIYGGRREGTLGADIDLGGEAAGAIELGKETVKIGIDAYQSASGVYQSLGNIQTAIDAIDSGAKAGAVMKYLPNVTEASASLNNAMNRMGLDVIGSVTFGALSEGEMKLAMSTAVPRDLSPKALRSWLVKKRDAQEKAARTLMDAAYYLTNPKNNINGWIERNRSKSPITPEAGSDNASDEDLFLKYGVE